MKDYNYKTLAEYYDLLEGMDAIDNLNVILEKKLKKIKPKNILDISCGTGLQAIFLAKKGYNVTAADFSGEMLKIAKKKAKGIKIKFKQGDMRSTNYGDFDVIISIFNAIGHLTKKEFAQALKNIYKNLSDKGVFIFDILNLNYMKKEFISHEFIDSNGYEGEILWVRFNKNKLDAKKGIMHMNQKTIIQHKMDKPKVYRERWGMQIYSPDELKDMIEKAGFELISFESIDGTKFKGDKDISILATIRKK